MVFFIKKSCLPFVGLTRLTFFKICSAIRYSHSQLITLALLSSKSLLLLKNETNLWMRHTFEFTVGKLSITVRPWDRGQNGESHGKTVRLGRSVSRLKKMKNEKITTMLPCKEEKLDLTS